MKIYKRILAMLLALALLFGITIPCIAIEKTNIETVTYEISAERLKMHKDIISGKANEPSLATYSEFDILSKLSEKSTAELVNAGYSVSTAEQISTRAIEEAALSEIFERSKLSDKQLQEMGYSNKEIDELQSLTGKETLSDIYTRGLFANCTCYNVLTDHYYKTSTGKTYMLVAYGWEWDKFPVMKLTDCVGTGWNHDFTPDNSLDNNVIDYNTTHIAYCETKDSPASFYSTVVMIEKQLQTSECMVPMTNSSKTALYGVGDMALSQTGKINDVKFAFKYAHNRMGYTPSVSYPWGVGFEFESAEDVYQPSSVAYNDFVEVIN